MEYKLVELGDYVDIIGGYAFKSKMFTNEGIPVLKIKNVQQGKVDLTDTQYISEDLYGDSLAKYLVKDKDILIAMTGQGSVGRVGRVYKSKNDKILLNQRVGNIKVKNNKAIDSDYLFYILSSKQYEEILFNAASGSGQPNLSPSIIKSIKIPWIEINKQRFIGRLLVLLDSKIQNNTNIIYSLESISTEIFKRWFIDFDFPNEQGLPYSSSGGEIIESEIGDIAKGWKLVSLYDLADYINGTSFKKQEIDENQGIPIIKIAELKSGITSSTKYFNGSKPKKFNIENGDILFSWSGNPQTSIDTFIWYRGKGILNQHIFNVIPTKYKKSFIYLILKYFKPTFADIASDKQTTGLGHVTVSDLKRIKIALPNDRLIGEFTEIVNGLVESIFSRHLENYQLEKLRETLLPKLLSGELEIPDESVVEPS